MVIARDSAANAQHKRPVAANQLREGRLILGRDKSFNQGGIFRLAAGDEVSNMREQIGGGHVGLPFSDDSTP